LPSCPPAPRAPSVEQPPASTPKRFQGFGGGSCHCRLAGGRAVAPNWPSGGRLRPGQSGHWIGAGAEQLEELPQRGLLPLRQGNLGCRALRVLKIAAAEAVDAGRGQGWHQPRGRATAQAAFPVAVLRLISKGLRKNLGSQALPPSAGLYQAGGGPRSFPLPATAFTQVPCGLQTATVSGLDFRGHVPFPAGRPKKPRGTQAGAVPPASRRAGAKRFAGPPPPGPRELRGLQSARGAQTKQGPTQGQSGGPTGPGRGGARGAGKSKGCESLLRRRGAARPHQAADA